MRALRIPRHPHHHVNTMTRTIRHIAPTQLGKILGLFQGLMGLICVPFLLLFAVFGAFAPRQHGAGAGMAVVFVGLAILAPIFYAVVGFASGAVGAAIYNAIAARIGGIELDFDGPDRA